MSLLTTVATALQDVFTTQAAQAARDAGFCQRRSPLCDIFAQAVTFACLGQTTPTLAHFCQAAAAAGVTVQPQAFDQRFTPQAADCLRRTLGHAVQQVIAQEPLATGLLARFTTVDVQDSSTLVLPDSLEELWQGNGGRTEHNTRSALKLHVRLDLRSGQLTGPLLSAGKDSDQSSLLQQDDLPAGSLRLADLGYFDLEVFARLDHDGVFWLSRWQYGTALYLGDDANTPRLSLLAWLQGQQDTAVDVPVRIGKQLRLRGRLVALRVPEAVAEQRRQRLRQKAQKRGKPVSAERLALCAWTLLLTNVPVTLASAAELAVLTRCRWQIELLFKLWKSRSGLGRSHSEQPYRVLCEVYGKLLAVVVQHWVLVAGCWQSGRRSLTKAAVVVKQQALSLVRALPQLTALVAELAFAMVCLSAGSRSHRSRKDPRTWQLLENPTHYGVPLS
jgi:hypothetical protein